MQNMGVYFEPPLHNNFRDWERLRTLAAHRLTCHSEGGKALIKHDLKNRPSARNLKLIIDIEKCLSEEQDL